MTQRMRNRLIELLMLFAIAGAAAFVMPRAHAEMIDTQAGERERVKALLERPELSKALKKLGVGQADAAARVDAMADAEVLQLAGRLEAALAGGQVSNETILLIIIIVLLLLILL